MTDAHSVIDKAVKSNDVMLFMKGTPQFPQCGFSSQVVQILDYLGVPFESVNVLADADIRLDRHARDQVEVRRRAVQVDLIERDP